MSGLDAAIRDWFARRLETMPCDDDIEVHESLQMAAHAVIAVLDLHAPRPAVEGPWRGRPICEECSDGTDEYLAHQHPCDTVLAIAKELGVEAEGA